MLTESAAGRRSFGVIPFVVVVVVVAGYAFCTNLASSASSYSSSSDNEQRLLNYLLRSYDTDARGVSKVNMTVRVELQLLLLRIHGLDWQDDRLMWRREEFGNIFDIVVRPDRIWLPELALMNGAVELAPDFRKVRALLRHDGHVHWEPGGVFTTTCDIDIRYFPFDDQSCPIQFGAWAYYSARMNITNASHEIQTHNFRLNGEWDIYRTTAVWKENILPCCPNTRYPYVEFTLFLRRKHAFFVINIILPCTLLSVLVMVVFCLPPDAGEKISLGISVLLAFTVFLLMVAENIPRTSLHVPVIVIYLTCTMALGTFSVCLTVFILNLHHRDGEYPVPRLAHVLILRYLASALWVQARKPKTLAESRRRFDSPEDATYGRRIRQAAAAAATTNHVGTVQHVDKPTTDYNNYSRSAVFNGSAGFGERRFAEKTEPLLFEEICCIDEVEDFSYEWKELAHVLDRLFFWIVLLSMTASAMIILTVPLYKEETIIYVN